MALFDSFKYFSFERTLLIKETLMIMVSYLLRARLSKLDKKHHTSLKFIPIYKIIVKILKRFFNDSLFRTVPQKTVQINISNLAYRGWS